ncbi:hypothetical protein EK904_011219 [Melospiza melodia maxima]|nr:hypothetical protein EK904_011219 [Melospiza melodia maxima]
MLKILRYWLAAASDPLQPPKAQPSQGIPGSAELLFSRSRTSRTVELAPEHPALAAGALGSHQPQVSGKCGTLGYSRGRSGSVGSGLQFLALNNCQQDKVCSSLSFASKTQRSFCTQAEPTVSFQGPSASQGTFILPSFPLASPRNSPKHLSAPAALAGRCQEDPRSLSSSWPLKSFQGLPKPGGQKQLLSQKPGDSTGDSQLEKPSLQLEKPSLQLEKPSLQLEKHSLQLEKHSLQLEKPPLQLEKPPLQLRSALGRGQALRGARPVPPIPRLPSPRERPGSREGTELAAGLAELHLQPEQMQNSLRSLRSSAAKKRAKLSSSMAELESPDSAVKLEFPGDCPSLGSSPGTTSTGESGISSLESLGSPAATLAPRRRVLSDTFPALGSKSHPAEASPARPRDPEGAEQPPNTGPAESVPGFAPKDDLGFSSGDVAVVGTGVFGSPPGPAASQPVPCVANGDAQGAREGAEAAPGRSFQNSPSRSCGHAGKEGEIKVTLSKSAQEKLRRRRKEDKEHNHKEHQEGKDLEGKEEFPWERIRLSMSEPEKLTAESEDEGDLFTHLKKSMDQEVDNAVKVLLHKAGESNTFIREEVDKALKAMVNNVTPARALCSLINGGQSHLHSAVRRCTAQHVGDIVQRLGPERLLAAGRPLAERLLPAVARFVQDSSQQTR